MSTPEASSPVDEIGPHPAFLLAVVVGSVTIAPTLTDTFAGVRPAGALAAAALVRWLLAPGGTR